MGLALLFERRVTFDSESIPGADHLADVTPENPIAHFGSQFWRNVIFEFNGKVGNAAGRVEGAIWKNAVRRAGFDATPAGAAMIRYKRWIRFKNQIQKDFGEQKIRAMFWVDKTGVFSDPANAGALCEITLKDGTGVCVATVPDWAANLLLNKLNEFFHPGREDIVIVLTQSIRGNSTRFVSTGAQIRRIVGSGQNQD